MAAAVFLGIVAILFGSALVNFKFSKLLLDGIYPALSSALRVPASCCRRTCASRRLAVAGLAAELQHEREMEARLDGELNAAACNPARPSPAALSGPSRSIGRRVYASTRARADAVAIFTISFARSRTPLIRDC